MADNTLTLSMNTKLAQAGIAVAEWMLRIGLPYRAAFAVVRATCWVRIGRRWTWLGRNLELHDG